MTHGRKKGCVKNESFLICSRQTQDSASIEIPGPIFVLKLNMHTDVDED
jgi:hypothetical protein